VPPKASGRSRLTCSGLLIGLIDTETSLACSVKLKGTVAALVLVPHQVDGMARPTVCARRWAAVVSSFERKHDELVTRHPDCAEVIALLRKALATISKRLHISPP
jgi:hypothetical protein